MLHSYNQSQQNSLQQLQKKDKLVNHEYNVPLSHLHPQCIKENLAIISNEATDKALNQTTEFESKQQMKKERQEMFAKQIEANAKKIQQLNRQKKLEQDKKKEEEKQKILNRSKISSISNKPQKKKAKQNEGQQIEQIQQTQNYILNEEEAGQGLETPILNVPAPTLQQIESEPQELSNQYQQQEQPEQEEQQQESDNNDDDENEQYYQENLQQTQNIEANQVDFEGISYKQPNPASAQIMIVQEAESEEEDEIEIVDPDEVVEQVQSLRERLRAFRA